MATALKTALGPQLMLITKLMPGGAIIPIRCPGRGLESLSYCCRRSGWGLLYQLPLHISRLERRPLEA